MNLKEIIKCEYKVVKGGVTTRKLRPIKVVGTNSESTIVTLQLLAIYPTTDTTIIKIINSKGRQLVKLVKQNMVSRRTTFYGKL